MKTSELTGVALDWAVGTAMKLPPPYWADGKCANFSTDWAQGGPIIMYEGLCFEFDPEAEEFTAFYPTKQGSPEGVGENHLIAAMRCYVAYRLGDEVEIPEELEGTA